MADAPVPEFVAVGVGAIAVTHRPKVKLLPAFRAAGATHLVTLLSKREGALAVGSAAESAGLGWIWVDLPNGQEPAPADRHAIVTALTTLTALIADGARVVIHCSAGIHRTGMFTYALLRTCGLDGRDALQTMALARAVTAEGVGEVRLSWAEDLATLARHRLPGPLAPQA